VLRQTLWMCNPRGKAPADWAKTERLSMEQLIRVVDHDRLIAYRRSIQRQVGLARLADRLTNEPWLPAAKIVALMTSTADAGLALRQVDPMVANGTSPLAQARVFKLAEVIRERFPRAAMGPALAKAGELQLAGSAAIARAVAQQINLPTKPRPAAVLHDQAVWVTTPVRIDLSGGWSDTPPICAELGGTVVNAAITLNGQYPVQVIAKLREDPVIMLNSIDLGQSIRLENADDIQRYQDPTDWAALPKAALILGGICPREPGVPLRRWLEMLGGGLDITLFSALPKGSGLGTSSVLGAAVLACLARVVGEKLTSETLIARTSMLEQLMTTGGGWQDQVGGITPGIKLIRTRPGPDQTPSLHWTAPGFFDRSAGGRLMLYYTGHRRMAKHILRNVVGRYLARDPEAIAVIHELKAAAEQMKIDLDSQNIEAVGRGIERYWSLKKRLDPGSTNPKIESLLKPLERDLIGKLLPGAGGGGFVFMVAKSEESAQRIRSTLQAKPPNPLARFFDFDVDPQGLKVTVL
jgi:fucokinase